MPLIKTDLPTPQLQTVWIALVCRLLASVLGSVRTFGVVLDPMERPFQASHSQASLTQSLTLLALKHGGVLLGPSLALLALF